ncbi:MAG: peptide chain release factor 2 [Chloroflexi bacterium]|nr:peptide chain release factor 2 [Chloroflexota bacterium]
MDNIISQLRDFQEQIDELMTRIGIADKAESASRLESAASQSDFWNDPESAQQTMQQLARLNALVGKWRGLAARVSDAIELVEIADGDMQAELEAETEALRKIVAAMSREAMLSGDYDSENAIFAIHAGAGGVDAQDWTEMLERMYLRWIEQNGYKAEVLDRSGGEEAGLKSVTISVKGDYAFGNLQSEEGVHRLVRLSPFDSARRRHTAFAKVELWPDIQRDIEITLAERDIRIDTYRASGAGGQHVQKNDTAVRITHLPTGLVVQCQNQRSQAQNRDRAMQILKARLFEMERAKQEAQMAELKGENVDAGWGNQIRSYVLHPYQMVKDHRTSVEIGNAAAVLDGRLGEFIDAYLRHKING